jgi:mRNA-degrading endonuclease RelE of RelBE toxin-antitoxin system
MVIVGYTNSFKKSFKKIKNNSFSKKIKLQIKKIVSNPSIGKPMRYDRKGTRESYVSPYRISYVYIKNKIIFLSIYHKDEQ